MTGEAIIQNVDSPYHNEELLESRYNSLGRAESKEEER